MQALMLQPKERSFTLAIQLLLLEPAVPAQARVIRVVLSLLAGPMNRSNAQARSGIPLAGECRVPYGQMLPASMGHQVRTAQTEGDVWKFQQGPAGTMVEHDVLSFCGHQQIGGSPRFSGHQGLASGRVAQSAGHDASSGFCAVDEWEVLLRRLRNMQNGPLMCEMLGGSNFEDEGWVDALRRIVSVGGC